MTGRRVSAVTLADERVGIDVVCRLVGVELPEGLGAGTTRKVHCPFGELYHSDHGADAAMRIYLDSNSAWCFSCGYFYTPVRLAARAWDCTAKVAAARLLDHVGCTPVDVAHEWAALVAHTVPPDREMLAEALKTFCGRICPQWPSRQFEGVVAGRLGDCLNLLDAVTTDAHAEVWLSGCKLAMSRVLTVVGEA